MRQIGYFGRPFETKKLREIQGDEKDYLRFVLGQKPNLMIPAMEEGLASMAEGGVRQLIVPPSIGYPKSDMAHETVGVRSRRLEPVVPCSRPLVLTCVPRPSPSPPSLTPLPYPAQPKPTTFSGQRALNFVLENQALHSMMM